MLSRDGKAKSAQRRELHRLATSRTIPPMASPCVTMAHAALDVPSMLGTVTLSRVKYQHHVTTVNLKIGKGNRVSMAFTGSDNRRL